MMLRKIFCRCCTFSFLLLKLLDLSAAVTANSDTDVTVGKMRSSADMFFANGELDKALEMWAKVISLEPENDNNYYKRFRVYLRQQKLKEALADLNSALTRNPSHESALTQRAKLSLRLGRCDDAEKDFTHLKR
jgi:tetratricopeptide (TPR) repeat protein